MDLPEAAGPGHGGAGDGIDLDGLASSARRALVQVSHPQGLPPAVTGSRLVSVPQACALYKCPYLFHAQTHTYSFGDSSRLIGPAATFLRRKPAFCNAQHREHAMGPPLVG